MTSLMSVSIRPDYPGYSAGGAFSEDTPNSLDMGDLHASTTRREIRYQESAQETHRGALLDGGSGNI